MASIVGSMCKIAGDSERRTQVFTQSRIHSEFYGIELRNKRSLAIRQVCSYFRKMFFDWVVYDVRVELRSQVIS